MLRMLIALALVITVSSQPAGAKGITEDMIAAQYDKMEKVLNNREDALGTIEYLHAHISDDASFKLTVTAPNAPGASSSPTIEMDKTDYINTYIQGTHFIDNYAVAIRTLQFEPGKDENEAYTVDVMTERGMMLNELNDGKPFVSRTTCRTRHEIQNGRLLATDGECHTDISYEEEI